MRAISKLGKMLKYNKRRKLKAKCFWSQVALANRRRGEERERAKSKRKRRKKRKKKEEKRFKNQVCLCLRIKCLGFLGLGYGD